MKASPGLAAVAIALSLAAAAHADQFSLSYVFGGSPQGSVGPGTVVTGTFNGTLNGDLVSGLSNVTMLIGGTSIGTVFPEGYVGSVNTDGAAVVSLDGLQNNFFFVNSDAAAGDMSFTAYVTSITGTIAQDLGANPNIEASSPTVFALDLGVVNSSWTITDLSASAVPEAGSTVALLAAALLGLAGLTKLGFGKAESLAG